MLIKMSHEEKKQKQKPAKSIVNGTYIQHRKVLQQIALPRKKKQTRLYKPSQSQKVLVSHCLKTKMKATHPFADVDLRDLEEQQRFSAGARRIWCRFTGLWRKHYLTFLFPRFHFS